MHKCYFNVNLNFSSYVILNFITLHLSQYWYRMFSSFFPHRKLVNSSERKSPRNKRTPGKRTPVRKTPGKKTPAKTPKTRSGGSSKKKAMRRLLMDSEHMTRSQPTRETLKRALFSPENRKTVPVAASTSVPAQAMKSKRALFGSPVRADTKSMDGTQSDQFLKRKRDLMDDDGDNGRSKIAKSLSFGGDTYGSSHSLAFARRASEAFATKTSNEWSEIHKKVKSKFIIYLTTSYFWWQFSWLFKVYFAFALFM